MKKVYLVANPEDRFSLNEAQMILTVLLNHEILCVQIFSTK